MFTTKTSRKSIFHPHEAHNRARLDITMMYIFFGGFEKYRILAQNPKGLAFGIIKKCLFTTKSARQSVFHPRKAHILCRG
jgi:hypothetical protein